MGREVTVAITEGKLEIAKVCDPTKSQTSWSNKPGTCMIDSVCKQPGDKHKLGCAECDPGTSSSAWTVKGKACLIDDVCKQPGDKDITGCGSCDPSKSKTAWQSACWIISPTPDRSVIKAS